MNISFTETLVVTVLAALLGLSMPLVMQAIERFDTRYKSSVVSTSFRKSRIYRSYFWMIWVSILFMLWLPWAPDPPECLSSYWIVKHSAHLLAWTSLSITLILLLLVFLEIKKYESPDLLLSKLTGITPDYPGGNDNKLTHLMDSDNQFSLFGAVMKYSMLIGNIQLFLNCNSVLGGCIGLCRKSASEGQPITYPDPIYNLINETLRISSRYYEELLYPSLNCPQTFLSAYFDIYGITTMSVCTLRQLWVNIVQLSRSNKPEWIKGYWVYATQYADYTVSNRIVKSYDIEQFEISHNEDSDTGKYDKKVLDKWNAYNHFVNEAKTIRLFHHMFSAFLLFQEKIDLVKWTISYTPSSLRTLFLIPQNIIDIVLELEEIEINPLILESNFSFFSEEGIKTGFMMEDWLIKYYIMVLSINNSTYANGLLHHNPWDEYELISTKDIKKIQNSINIIEKFSNQFYYNCEYFDSIGIEVDKLNDIYKKLMELVEKLIKVRDNLIQNSNINATDLENGNNLLKCGLSTVVKGINQITPIKSEFNDLQRKDITLLINSNVDIKHFAYDERNFCRNSVPTILAGMHFQLVNHYLNLFRLSKSVLNINIDYSELLEALSRLQIPNNNSYAILPIDVSVSDKSNNTIEPPLSGSGQAQILIIPKNQLPSVEINSTENSKLSCEKNDTRIFLKAEAKAQLILPERLSFLRMVIINSLYDGRKSELSKIKSIETYFKGLS